MNAQDIYKPENNLYFGPNKPSQSIVLESKDYGRGCIMLIERNTFGYGFTKTGKGKYKIGRTLVIEVWEYESTKPDALPCIIAYLDLKTKSKRLGYQMLEESVVDNNSAGEPILTFVK